MDNDEKLEPINTTDLTLDDLDAMDLEALKSAVKLLRGPHEETTMHTSHTSHTAFGQIV